MASSPDWPTLRFDQIAHNIAERVNPAEAETDIYVGLEHLDPESLHLKRWGTPADVKGTKLRFYKGDIIFGRRRAYQRKLAVAEFDGICSAHAMVLRANEQTVLSEFLPFFLQSDTFFDRALQISVGSLSPTINWKTLAKQKFTLPPQGRADYAFFQHIIRSLDPQLGRCAILFPHGVLFRDEEAEMRAKLVKADIIECVLGLGPNLFYNSPMEACVIICRISKPPERRGKILFINAVNEVTRERAQSFLEDDHIEKIVNTYHAFADAGGFANAVTLAEIEAHHGNLSIPLYVQSTNGYNDNVEPEKSLSTVIETWQKSSLALRESMTALFTTFETTGILSEEENG